MTEKLADVKIGTVVGFYDGWHGARSCSRLSAGRPQKPLTHTPGRGVTPRGNNQHRETLVLLRQQAMAE